MRPLALVTLLGILALSTAGAANSRPQPPPWKQLGSVNITIKGLGSVTLSWGFFGRKVLGCGGASCRYVGAGVHRRRVVLTAKPYKRWKLVRWGGACKGKRPKCTIDFSHRHKDRRGFYSAAVTVSFLPVGKGVTRGNPIRLGHAAYIGEGWRLRINSFTPNAQLSPPPPAGAEYVVANMTLTNIAEEGNPINFFLGFLDVIGSHKVAYHPSDCPADAPPPALDSVVPPFDLLGSGQSATGNLCWQIATNDASTLELHTDPRIFYPGFWFALH
jgi:hypothetical protein